MARSSQLKPGTLVRFKPQALNPNYEYGHDNLELVKRSGYLWLVDRPWLQDEFHDGKHYHYGKTFQIKSLADGSFAWAFSRELEVASEEG